MSLLSKRETHSTLNHAYYEHLIEIQQAINWRNQNEMPVMLNLPFRRADFRVFRYENPIALPNGHREYLPRLGRVAVLGLMEDDELPPGYDNLSVAVRLKKSELMYGVYVRDGRLIERVAKKVGKSLKGLS